MKGKISDLSFYKTKDCHLAREKGGVDGDRIANDPGFNRTWGNGAVFGSSATAGKLMRDALLPLIMHACDGRVISKLTKLMTDIKNLDATELFWIKVGRSLRIYIPCEEFCVFHSERLKSEVIKDKRST